MNELVKISRVGNIITIVLNSDMDNLYQDLIYEEICLYMNEEFPELSEVMEDLDDEFDKEFEEGFIDERYYDDDAYDDMDR